MQGAHPGEDLRKRDEGLGCERQTGGRKASVAAVAAARGTAPSTLAGLP